MMSHNAVIYGQDIMDNHQLLFIKVPPIDYKMNTYSHPYIIFYCVVSRHCWSTVIAPCLPGSSALSHTLPRMTPVPSVHPTPPASVHIRTSLPSQSQWYIQPPFFNWIHKTSPPHFFQLDKLPKTPFLQLLSSLRPPISVWPHGCWVV